MTPTGPRFTLALRNALIAGNPTLTGAESRGVSTTMLASIVGIPLRPDPGRHPRSGRSRRQRRPDPDDRPDRLVKQRGDRRGDATTCAAGAGPWRGSTWPAADHAVRHRGVRAPAVTAAGYRRSRLRPCCLPRCLEANDDRVCGDDRRRHARRCRSGRRSLLAARGDHQRQHRHGERRDWQGSVTRDRERTTSRSGTRAPSRWRRTCRGSPAT